MTKLPPPTAECARLVQIMGAEGALALIEWQGGARYYVPREVVEGDRLAQEVGLEAARALVAVKAREYLKVPIAREWRVLVYRSRAMSYEAIAKRLVCSRNTVWRLLDKHDMIVRQLDLF